MNPLQMSRSPSDFLSIATTPEATQRDHENRTLASSLLRVKRYLCFAQQTIIDETLTMA
ncbi:MAG: hypothetical protein Q8P85_05950 [Pseudomonas sp.]|nr:hypothetical protein [Pseudomonas sp.]